MNYLRTITLVGSLIFLIGLSLRWQTGNSAYDLLMILPLLAVFGAYSLGPQLRWRYWMKHPPELPGDLAPLLERFDLYRRLGLDEKREFRRRTFLLKERFHFHGQAIEELPPDLLIMVAASAATVGFHRTDFLLGDYETVVFYRHYFPTPQHDVLHCSELHEEDGAIIWTLNVFLRSVIEPRKYLQLGLYEYSRALFTLETAYAERLREQALSFREIKAVSGFTEEALIKFIGLPELDRAAITHVLYFTHREEMEALQPATVTGIDELRRRTRSAFA